MTRTAHCLSAALLLTLALSGCQTAKRRATPSNVTLAWPPSHSPEISPVERIWLYLRGKH